MVKFIVEVATRGTAWCSVVAESEDEAIDAARNAGEWQQDEWDICTEPYRGGFIAARKE